MILNFVLIVAGFYILVKGADFFLKGAVSLSLKFKIPAIIIGLTVVAFGTSAPELFVSGISALKGLGEITLGNIIGSNIANILLVLGLASIFYPLKAPDKVVVREIPFMILTAFALFFIADDLLFNLATQSFISRGDSLILLLFFSIFMYYLIFDAIRSIDQNEITEEFKEIEESKILPTKLMLLFMLFGLLGLAFGGRLVVDNATLLALSLGISQSLVGLTIVAIGTSLPELVTTVMAAKNKQTDIAIGNIVGSNVFNTVFILGVAGFINPIYFNQNLRPDIVLMILVSLVLMIMVLRGKKISLREGVILFVSYIFYMIFVIARR
jgi:cation:H+ antiporter